MSRPRPCYLLLHFNSFFASGDLMSAGNLFKQFGPRSYQIRPDLDPNCLTPRWYSLIFFFEKVNFQKKSAHAQQ